MADRKDAFKTSPGRYLVATTNGVWSFDVENLQLKNLSFISDDGEDIGKSDAASILVDNQQRTWIALMNDRLYCFDRDGKQVRFKVDGKPYDDNPNTSTTIIALTANEIEGDRERCLKIGMNAYLPKPIRPKNLNALLHEWLPSPLKSITKN